MQCVPSLFLSLSLSESLALSLSICCSGIWEDFKHGETKWKRKSLREREKALKDGMRGGVRESKRRRQREIYCRGRCAERD